MWDGGYAITTKCKVNIKTKEIFDIDSVDAGDDFDCLDREFVMVGGEYYEAIRIDEDENEHLGLYWYKCGRKNYERKDESKWKITEIRNT